MRKLYLLLVFLLTISIFAQAPQGFNYQATVRNAAGELVANQNVYFKFNLMLNTPTSVPVYSETHYVPTDDMGQVNLIIGTGTPTIGTLSAINWGIGNYYLGIEMSTGASYTAMGTTQLLSVPYALYANSAGNGAGALPNLAAVLATNNEANNLQIKNLADPTDAQDAVTKNYLDTQFQSQIAILQVQINSLLADIDNDKDGFTENQGDCDDSNSEINPSMVEIPNDGIDNNCDGVADVVFAPATIAVPGNHQLWNPATAPKLASSSPGLTDYEGFVFLDGEYKLIAPNSAGSFSWGNGEWSDDGSASGKLTYANSSQLNFTAPRGYYKLKVNTTTLTYSKELTTWSLIGANTPGGWTTDTPMTFDSSSNKWTTTLTLSSSAGGLKFRANNNWDLNLGDTGNDGTIDADGDNIIIPAGTYHVTLDLTNPRHYRYYFLLL